MIETETMTSVNLYKWNQNNKFKITIYPLLRPPSPYFFDLQHPHFSDLHPPFFQLPHLTYSIHSPNITYSIPPKESAVSFFTKRCSPEKFFHHTPVIRRWPKVSGIFGIFSTGIGTWQISQTDFQATMGHGFFHFRNI